MNQFEKKMNALRIQFCKERDSITKDACRRIGRLNTAIGMVNTQEARDVLRAEKERIYEAMRQSHKYNRICYRQQLEAIEAEAQAHFEKNPTKRQIRHALRSLLRYALENGESSLSFCLGGDWQCTVTCK